MNLFKRKITWIVLLTGGIVATIGGATTATLVRQNLNSEDRLGYINSSFISTSNNLNKNNSQFINSSEYQVIYDLILRKKIEKWFDSEFQFCNPKTNQSVADMISNKNDLLWKSLYLSCSNILNKINYFNGQKISILENQFGFGDSLPQSWKFLKLDLSYLPVYPEYFSELNFENSFLKSSKILNNNEISLNLSSSFLLFPKSSYSNLNISKYVKDLSIFSYQANEKQIFDVFSDYGQIFLNQFLGNYEMYSRNNGWNINEIQPKINGEEISNSLGKIIHLDNTLDIPLSDMEVNGSILNNGFWKYAYKEFKDSVIYYINSKFKNNILHMSIGKSIRSILNLSNLNKLIFSPISYGINFSKFDYAQFLSSISVETTGPDSAKFIFLYGLNKNNSKSRVYEINPINYEYVQVESNSEKGNKSIGYKEIDNRINYLNNEISKYKSLIFNQSKKINLENLEIKDLNQKELFISSKIDAISKKIEYLENDKLVPSREKIKFLKNELSSINLTINELQNKISSYKNIVNECSDEIFKLKNEIESSKQKIYLGDEENKYLSGKIGDINSEYKYLESQISNDESIINSQNQSIDNLNSQKDSYEEEINRDNLKINNLENEILPHGLTNGDYVGIGIGVGILIATIFGFSIWYKLRKNKLESKKFNFDKFTEFFRKNKDSSKDK